MDHGCCEWVSKWLVNGTHLICITYKARLYNFLHKPNNQAGCWEKRHSSPRRFGQRPLLLSRLPKPVLMGTLINIFSSDQVTVKRQLVKIIIFLFVWSLTGWLSCFCLFLPFGVLTRLQMYPWHHHTDESLTSYIYQSSTIRIRLEDSRKTHRIHDIHVLHPWKLTCPPKSDHFSREYIFQPSILNYWLYNRDPYVMVYETIHA